MRSRSLASLWERKPPVAPSVWTATALRAPWFLVRRSRSSWSRRRSREARLRASRLLARRSCGIDVHRGHAPSRSDADGLTGRSLEEPALEGALATEGLRMRVGCKGPLGTRLAALYVD